MNDLISAPVIGHSWIFLALCLVFTCAAGAVFCVPFLVKYKKESQEPLHKHAVRTPVNAWILAVQKTREAFHNNEITKEEAYTQLSHIARAFASDQLGGDFSAQTLLDLRRHKHLNSKQQFESLRQTIAALYPPEFAPPHNVAAQEADVDTAAQWVESMISGWNR